MDTIDLAIIKMLMMNARIPLSSISDRINLSINAVKKRITKMENKGVIQGYTCELGYGVLGEETGIAKIAISGSVENTNNLADTIGKHEMIFLVSTGIGNSMIAVFYYRGSSEVIRLESWLKSLSQVKDVEIYLLISPPAKTGFTIAPVDYKIISIMKSDARMTLKQLALKTKVSTRTLKKRLDRMLSQELVQFLPKLSPGSSEELNLFVEFCTIGPKADKIEIFQAVMSFFPESWVGWIVVGKPMIIVGFFAPGLKHVNRIEEELKKTYPIVATECIIGGDAFYYDSWRDKYVEEMARKLMVS
ncbi:MAG: winged helix-turn-helix transcriptional regulator [Candidatus Odinarchaeota archaeon]